MPVFRVDTAEVEKFSKKLQIISKSALPVAIRESLNDCARDMKMKTMVESAKKSFISRTQNDNFFRANSAYQKATGFNISSMEATMGMTENNLRDGGKNHAIKDLEEQESGGTIEKSTMIPLNSARTGNNAKKLVRANARLKSIKGAVNANSYRGMNQGQKFLLAAMKAGNGGYVIAANKGENLLWRINSVFSSIKSKGLVVKATPLYDVNKGRSVKVKATHFVEKAAEKTHKKIDGYFIERAEKAIKKFAKW